MTAANFIPALNAFIAATQLQVNAAYASPYSDPPVLSADPGHKYVKIVKKGSQTSVHSFVRIADGAILKAEGWKKPAKHARGSIFVNAGQDAVGPYGANYLR